MATSRGYVREALKLLGADGFVILSHGKGAMVAKISYQETKDLYQLLTFLETKCVELAAQRLNGSDLSSLMEINGTLRACTLAEDCSNVRKLWQDGNLQFHRIFAERSGNRELKEMVENVRWRTFDFRYVHLFEPHFGFFTDQHDSLIGAIRRKCYGKAKIIMEDHIQRASEVVLRGLDRIQSP